MPMTEPAETKPATDAPASPAGPAQATQRNPRKIVLFSDGTGNSSAKLQKTNVWRLYEALDLGHVEGQGQDQIAFYDNGVGTSSIRPLALLGGVFGFGLARNVREIYKFISRNYQPGDKIYAFGFSRGAYTIRLVVALVCAMGVYRHKSERDLELAANDIWRQLRRGFHTNNCATDFLVALARAFRRSMIRIGRYMADEPSNYRFMSEPRHSWLTEWMDYWGRKRDEEVRELDDEPCLPGFERVEVEFVGVWDTVAAYGGPIVELTRAVDEWLWPLTMPHYRLHHRVKIARHALAIDDKRDSFQPLLWDEVYEGEAAERLKDTLEQAGDSASSGLRTLANRFNNGDRPRLQQVWFAGMHSDVGGGYADESLAFVSLWWMIGHAEDSGLRLIDHARDHIRKFQNVSGPLHDSRSGIGALYRYQPRYINAWVDHDPPQLFRVSYPRGEVKAHVQPATQIFRDPTIYRGQYARRGLLRKPVLLHQSVAERLHFATDGYGPNNLPSHFKVDRGLSPGPGQTFAPVVQSDDGDVRSEAELLLDDRIKLRRWWYFVSIWLLVILVTRPAWPNVPVLREFVGSVDERTPLALLESALVGLLPSFLGKWFGVLLSDLYTTLILLGLIVLTMGLGKAHERDMKDLSHRLWTARFAGQEPKIEPVLLPSRVFLKFARFMHECDILQGLLAFVKWRIVPFVLGFFLLAGALYSAAALASQAWLALIESRTSTCVQDSSQPGTMVSPSGFASKWFSVRSVCNDLGAVVEAGKSYRVVVMVRAAQDAKNKCAASATHPWCDGSASAGPRGWTAGQDGGWKEPATRYFRRVTTAPAMAPILEYRPESSVIQSYSWFWRTIVGVPSYMQRPKLHRSSNDPSRWEGILQTPPVEAAAFNRRGESEVARAYGFINEASVLNLWYGYDDNHGEMQICLIPADVDDHTDPCTGTFSEPSGLTVKS